MQHAYLGFQRSEGGRQRSMLVGLECVGGGQRVRRGDTEQIRMKNRCLLAGRKGRGRGCGRGMAEVPMAVIGDR